jgi:taurine dioxygenase
LGYKHISCEPGAPHAGAEISGVDLTRPLSSGAIREIRLALVTHGVVGFRDQPLTIEQQIRFAAQFGVIYIHPVADKTSRYPEILAVYADELSARVFGEEWHSDASCDDEPPMGSILTLQELPTIGGDTMFASMYAAYDALSEPLKQMLQGLTAVHSGAHVFRRRFDPTRTYPTNEHPVICVHPESGRKYLFVNPQYTTHIVQLKAHESDAVLAMLYRHLDAPEFHYRFKWTPNSVVFWENRCVQHRAVFDYFPQRRVGTRVQVCGTRPAGVSAAGSVAQIRGEMPAVVN